MDEVFPIALLGLGTVGSGVAGILTEHAQRVARQANRSIHIKHVVVRDVRKSRPVQLSATLVTDDFQQVLDDPDVRVVVELMGGIEPARTVIREALRRGKHVVTANKALLAEHGPELFETARTARAAISFEAAVAGGVPVVAGLGQSLTANQVQSISAILNGTSNFIVTQMEESQAPYEQALREAQRLGFAEADPSMDVDGTDAAQKLAILAQLAFRSNVAWRDIPRRGIDTLQQADMHYAAELGFRVKLLARAEYHAQVDAPHSVALHVNPCLVRRGLPLAEVRGAFNAITIEGDVVGQVFFLGLGAGQMPTASAVVADIVDMALGRAPVTFNALRLWSPDTEQSVSMRDPRLAHGRYYVRLRVDDHSGVLAEVSGVFSAQDISIASVIQHEPVEHDPAPGVDLVIMTHETTQGAMQIAVTQLSELDAVLAAPITMHVLG